MPGHPCDAKWGSLDDESNSGCMQDDHSPGEPGKVGEFQSGQGKWKKSGKSRGNS